MSGANDPYDPKQVAALSPEALGEAVTAAQKAFAEAADLEALARDALADVRSTAMGVRGISLPGEIAAAREALAAANVEADLPGAADEVPTRNRELFAWTIREAVTNVVRHSGARHVRVLLAGDPFSGAARRIAAELADETVASRLADGDASVWAGVGTGSGASTAPGPARPCTGWASCASATSPWSSPRPPPTAEMRSQRRAT